MRSRGSEGFTLPELLIVVVLGTVIMMATYGVLITNQRTYTVQNAQIQGQQTVRAGLEVLSGELREISPPGGDLLQMDDQRIRFNGLRGLAIACNVDAPGNKIIAMNVGEPLTGGSLVYIFQDNNPNLRNDDVWLAGTISSVGSGTCPNGTAGQTLNLPGVGSAALAGVLVGGPVRAYREYEYFMGTFDGESYLFSRDRTAAGDPQPLVGPLAAGDGLRFRYFDEDGVPTTTATDVARIGVRLITRSGIIGPDNQPVTDTLRALVYTRN